MNSIELRKTFLNYFKEKQHQVVSSSSLVPGNDPTLLFTNAGMVQFKDVFLGLDHRPYKRAVTVQRCVRAGGKHNDLENVGYTARHHTFFEMLGNFSFGDYFKREAIQFAWDFLTNVLKLPQEKLWITVFEEDEEAAQIWLSEMKVSPHRFSRCGRADNFWAMGDTGPCGPCSEIFYDHGESVPGGPPGSPEADGDRYIEIWNMVFMQYDRQPSGELKPLPKPSVDTGMGLERLAAVMQGVHNNYDIDLFQNLLKAARVVTGCEDITNTSMRVIADHIRSCAFLVADGVIPSNEGRGYVLRRILRRAVRHGYQLGVRDTFFYKLVAPLVGEMGEAYPELANAQSIVEQVLKQEEEQFAKTLEQGLKILEQDIQKLKGNIIPGSTIFKLYDTYGFPPDLTGDIARERNLQLDMKGFEEEMQRQREQSKVASKFTFDYQDKITSGENTQFTGYELLEDEVKVSGLYAHGVAVEQLKAEEEGIVVLEHTPFYAESGGQVGDKGLLRAGEMLFEVSNTQKQGKTFTHKGHVRFGTLKVGDKVSAVVDKERRRAIALNHTATHLLHAALRQVLGTHVMQKGSLVEADRLRFDFAHFSPLTVEEINTLEHVVNQQILANTLVETHHHTPEEAIEKGAMALFGEKYDSMVRVLEIGNFSMELCGGTHVQRTGDIGLFKITSETGIAAGIRRIEAVTGIGALDWIKHQQFQLGTAAELLKASTENEVVLKIQQVLEENRRLAKEIRDLKQKSFSNQSHDLMSEVKVVEGVKVLSILVEGVDAKGLRDLQDSLRNKLNSGIIVLGSREEGKVNLIAAVTKDLCERISAGHLVNYVAQQVGGKGGGRPDMAQAGGTEPEKLPKALESVSDWVKEQLVRSK